VNDVARRWRDPPAIRRQATPIGLPGSRSSTCSREIV
jgi:hypothetical protein